ncbi:MAG TPA: S8 family serine peptidase [Anaerolineales bacterium]
MKTPKYVYLLIALVVLVILTASSVPARALPAASSVTNAAVQQPSDPPGVPTDQIILKYKSPEDLNGLQGQAQANQVQRLSEAGGVALTYVRQMSGEAQVLRLPERMPVEQVRLIAQRLAALPEVAYAEADAIMQHTALPNDPLYANQWHYFAPTAGNYGINAPAAWDITTGAAGVVVAVIDTGITNHADLNGRTVPGYDFIGDVQVANDGDGRDSDAGDPGDWITPAENSSGYFAGCAISDSSWHGTHTAGTVGAASNNGVGVAGVNWNSKILPVRVLGKCGGYTTDIVDAMRWAAGLNVPGVPDNPNPAKVLNLSLGGFGACDITYQNAINAINSAGATVAVSAGNSTLPASLFTPANCNGVITVAATNRNGGLAYYSNYGSTVEISAPGGAQNTGYQDGVLSTLNTGLQGPVAGTYDYYQGTSMAAPHVSGVASLLYSLDPGLTPAQVLQILQDTATHFPSGSSCDTSDCGSGIVNAGAAVEYVAVGPTETPIGGPTNTPTATPISTGCTNLLADPSFEAYTPNPYWTEASSNFGTPLCTTAGCGDGGGTTGPRSGNVWAWFGGTASDETASLEQTVTVPPGTTSLQFYFWIGAATSGSGSDDVFTAQIDAATLFGANATQAGSYPGYTLVEVDASAFADGGSHTLRFSTNTSDQLVSFNIDDVALCQDSGVPTDTPTPTATATPTPTDTPTPTATATPVPEPDPIYLPVILR